MLSCSDGGTSRRMSRVSTGGGRAAAGVVATGRSNRERGDVRDRLRLAPGSVAADGAARPAIQHHARRLRACAVADRKQLGVARRPTRVLRLRRLQGSLHTHTHSHTHPFNGPLSGTTRVTRYQKGKTNLDFTEARDSEWQWHQLSHMQVCTSLQTDNHASTIPLCFYRPDALPAAQPTASKH